MQQANYSKITSNITSIDFKNFLNQGMSQRTSFRHKTLVVPVVHGIAKLGLVFCYFI